MIGILVQKAEKIKNFSKHHGKLLKQEDDLRRSFELPKDDAAPYSFLDRMKLINDVVSVLAEKGSNVRQQVYVNLQREMKQLSKLFVEKRGNQSLRIIEKQLKMQVQKAMMSSRPSGKENENSRQSREFYDSFDSSDFDNQRIRVRSQYLKGDASQTPTLSKYSVRNISRPQNNTIIKKNPL